MKRGNGLASGLLLAAMLLGQGCYVMRPSSGGAQTDFAPPRQVAASDVAVPRGYRIEVVATGLTFPFGIPRPTHWTARGEPG